MYWSQHSFTADIYKARICPSVILCFYKLKLSDRHADSSSSFDYLPSTLWKKEFCLHSQSSSFTTYKFVLIDFALYWLSLLSVSLISHE